MEESKTSSEIVNLIKIRNNYIRRISHIEYEDRNDDCEICVRINKIEKIIDELTDKLFLEYGK